MGLITATIIIGLYRFSPALAVTAVFGICGILACLFYPWWVSRKGSKPGNFSLAKPSPAECDLSIVVPAYNEEQRLPIMLKQTIGWLRKNGVNLEIATRQENQSPRLPWLRSAEIVVVDDGSKDKTAQVAESFGVRVISLAQNSGKGEAVKIGVLAAKGRVILMADADGATEFSDLERLYDAGSSVKDRMNIFPEEDSIPSGISTPSTIDESLTPATPGNFSAPLNCAVFGSRDHLKSSEAVIERAPIRNVLMLVFHGLVWLIVGTKIKDTQCGFKLFPRRAAQQIFASLHLTRWAFDIEVVEICRRLEIPIIEVPVNWREIAGSKLNLVTGSLGMLQDMAAVRFLYGIGVWRVAEKDASKEVD